jgi:hypothetical protein
MPAKRVILDDDDPLIPREFTWWVSEAGYSWERSQLASQWSADLDLFAKRRPNYAQVLIDRDWLASRRTYSPLSIPELFRVFADTPLDPDGIRAFANEYGPLGVEVKLFDRARAIDHRRRPQNYTHLGEPLSAWREEIAGLRRATRLWAALRSNNSDEVVRWVHRWCERTDSDVRWCTATKTRIDEDDAWLFVELGDDEETIGLFWMPALLGPGDPKPFRRILAWRSLLWAVNNRLKKHCGQALYPRDEDDSEFAIRPLPTSLLGAMWWQLARAIAGEARYVKCKFCKRLIELSRGDFGSRSDREFCGPSCKFKDHRRKVKEAKRLKDKGKTVEQIAERLGTKAKHVRKWLMKKK